MFAYRNVHYVQTVWACLDPYLQDLQIDNILARVLANILPR